MYAGEREGERERERGEKPIKRGLDHFPFRTNLEDKVIMSDISSNIFESLSTNPLFFSLSTSNQQRQQMKEIKQTGAESGSSKKVKKSSDENVLEKNRLAQKG